MKKFDKTFIIAEVGINHNGSVEIAKKLIDAAIYAGADAVKFQKRTIEKVYSKEELDKPRESPWGTTNREQKLGLEFGKKEYDDINNYCKHRNIPWFASAWDLESQDFLLQYGCTYNKVASALLTHYDLLMKIASEKKYTFISTGMSTLKEVEAAVEIFRDLDCPFQLLHCNSQYPMPDDKANLRCMKLLKHQFNCEVGYSGHEAGLITSVAAVAMGANCIERHITLDRSMYGSDQAASVEPDGFKRLVDYIRVVESALGDGNKIVTPEEEKVKAKLRRVKDY
jgi:N-acetylneuraminate synthase